MLDLASALGELKLDFKHGILKNETVTLKVNTAGELSAISDDAYGPLDEVILWFGGAANECTVSFDRASKERIDYLDANASYIKSSSDDPNLTYRLSAAVHLLEHKYEDILDLTTSRFTTTTKKDEDSFLGFFSSKMKEAKEDARNKVSWWVVGSVIVAAIAIVPSFWQGTSTSSQAKTADLQYKMDAGALFKLAKLPHDQSSVAVNRRLDGSISPFDVEITNVGRNPAQNVYLRCGNRNAHGPYLALGTIGVGGSYVIHGDLYTDPNDIIHARDGLCTGSDFLIYDDAAGHHIVSFDTNGNAHTEAAAEE